MHPANRSVSNGQQLASQAPSATLPPGDGEAFMVLGFLPPGTWWGQMEADFTLVPTSGRSGTQAIGNDRKWAEMASTAAGGIVLRKEQEWND